MPLPEFLRPKPTERSPASDEGQAVQAARTRARQRLLGALVLLVVGVIAFPLLFETQPRPLSADTPIRLTQRDSGVVGGPATATPKAPRPELPADAGVEAPAAGSPASAPSAPVAAPLPAPTAASAPVKPPAASTPAKPPATVVAAASAPAASRPEVRPVATAPSAPKPKPEPKPETKQPPKPATPASAAPVTAAAAPATTGRFVVQVGAFGDARTLREARQKVAKLGLETYTQVVESASGPRTRVRVGPFDTRSEAEAAAKTLQGGGLPAAILAL